jgi:hypothetical protein
MGKLQNVIRWIKSLDNIHTAANIFLWLILLNIADMVITLIAIYYDCTEQNPFFAKLFYSGQFELAMILKLSLILLFGGYWLFALTLTYQTQIKTKILLFFQKTGFYSGLICLQAYLFIVINNLATLVALFTNKWIEWSVYVIGGLFVGAYYAKLANEYLKENQ